MKRLRHPFGYRAKAFDWARNVARDSHLAEDIVQEALLRAFMRLGSLADMDRFRIVRNEALMKLRKGEHSGRERTFTGMGNIGRSADSIDWTDLDSILYYMSGYKEQSGDDRDPPDRLTQKEFIGMMRLLLRCLTAKEWDVFEAHLLGNAYTADELRMLEAMRRLSYAGWSV